MSEARIALIGCGGWGKNIARSLAALNNLHVIVDPADFARSLAGELGVSHVSSVNEIAEDDDVDAYVIATPAETHFTVASQAMAKGKDVFIEKPIALSSQEGRKLAELARGSQRILMVGHLLQYHPAYRTLREMAQQGALGTLRHITSNRLNLGMLRNEENVMWSFAPHDVSMTLGLAGPGPIRVSCVGSTFFQPGIADITTMHLEFSDGMTAEIRSSWFNPEKEQKLTVVGDRAMAVFSDTAAWADKLKVQDYEIEHAQVRPRAIGKPLTAIDVAQGEPLKIEMQHFLDCIAQRVEPRTNALEALRVLAVLEAAEESLQHDGGWVSVIE